MKLCRLFSLTTFLMLVGGIGMLPVHAGQGICDAPAGCDSSGVPVWATPAAPGSWSLDSGTPGMPSTPLESSMSPDNMSSDATTSMPNAPNMPAANAPPLGFQSQDVALSGNTFAAFDSKAGYIDSALVRSQVRFRFDAAYDINRPDRAEFFYTTWRALGGKNPNPDDNPPGFPEPHIDQQAFWFYAEKTIGSNFSVFADLPIILSDPLRNPNEQGIGDLLAGIKVSLYRDCDQQLTFQLKNYIPTADAANIWVGTGHYSIEPGFLYYGNLTRNLSLEAELRDWVSIGGAKFQGQDYAGNVLRYGLGVGYNMGNVGNYSVKPILEFVGWSVLEGQVFDFNDAAVDPTNANISAGDIGPVDADGDTIVNIKIGTRVANCCGGSLYAGWGHSLTGDRWYQDIFRFELRRMF